MTDEHPRRVAAQRLGAPDVFPCGNCGTTIREETSYIVIYAPDVDAITLDPPKDGERTCCLRCIPAVRAEMRRRFPSEPGAPGGVLVLEPG